MIVMCMHCRRTLRQVIPEENWQMIHEWALKPPSQVSHGICPECLATHYTAWLTKRNRPLAQGAGSRTAYAE